jgi:hypothetical protein
VLEGLQHFPFVFKGRGAYKITHGISRNAKDPFDVLTDIFNLTVGKRRREQPYDFNIPRFPELADVLDGVHAHKFRFVKPGIDIVERCMQ